MANRCCRQAAGWQISCALRRSLLAQLVWWQPGRCWRMWRMHSLMGAQKGGDVEMGGEYSHRQARPQ